MSAMSAGSSPIVNSKTWVDSQPLLGFGAQPLYGCAYPRLLERSAHAA